MTLVEDAEQSWKWFSMQAMTLAAAIQGAWVFIPEDMKSTIPHNYVTGATVVLLVAGILGRLVKQNAIKS
jgi:hypothetical protein